jgi:hypothetical protein
MENNHNWITQTKRDEGNQTLSHTILSSSFLHASTATLSHSLYIAQTQMKKREGNLIVYG